MPNRDWRALLGDIRVPWVDRGPNVGPGNINVACPWCMNDPSQHLSIALEKDAYYCFRDHRHRGTNIVFLVMSLAGMGREEATHLLNAHLGRPTTPIPITPAEPSKMQHAWDRFRPASELPACLEFLAGRGFPDPASDILRYNLRFAEAGEWAGRLLIPLTVGGSIMSWTGRAIGPIAKPKYRTQSAPGYPVVYAPNQDRLGRIAIIVEGPLDALKIASATVAQPYLPIALCGKTMNAAKLLEIRWLTSGCEMTLVALDADVKLGEVYQIVAELAGALRTPVRRIALPAGVKDPGELDHERIIPWLKGAQ